MRFMHDSTSDPEGAFLLSLILFYGLTTQELQTAILKTCDDHLIICFDRPPRSYGRHFYNREEALKLPKTPIWFAELQRRFYDLWLKRYAPTKKTQLCRRLLLPEHKLHTRPICDRTLNKRIYKATMAATDTCITSRVLRQTCGHLYSKNQDGSLLSKLGWSPQFAFHYTWLPRKIDTGHNPPNYFDKMKI